MSVIIGVCKGYYHGMSERHWRAKRRPYATFIDENGKFSKKRIKSWQIPFYKIRVHHRIKSVCKNCGCRFLKLVKHISDKVPCPSCSELG